MKKKERAHYEREFKKLYRELLHTHHPDKHPPEHKIKQERITRKILKIYTDTMKGW